MAAKKEEVAAYDDVEQKIYEKTNMGGHVKISLLPANDYEQTTLQLLSQQVSDLLRHGRKPKDIAILVRSNNYIPLIARYFMEQLPDVKVVSDEAFRLDASSAVMTIVQGLRLLTHPDDPIAQAYLTPLTPHLTPLTSHLMPLTSLPLYEQAETLFSLLQVDRMEQQSAYLCAFYDQVISFAADRGSDTDAFLRAWGEELCSKTIQSPEADGIRIISIHKSKGLEFPCVLIPFCDWQLEKYDDVLCCTPTEEPFSKLPLAPIKYSQRGMTGTIYDSDYKEEHQQNIVDNLNLLYVAFTRAGSELYVYGKRKASANTRSALIEQVLPEVEKELNGPNSPILTGVEDEKEPLVFEYGKVEGGGLKVEGDLSAARNSPSTLHLPPSTFNLPPSTNPFLQPAIPIKVSIETFSARPGFKQSNQSREFLGNDYGVEDDRQAEYIKLGNVMHRVLASIRSTDDIDDALTQMEQDGVLFGEGELTRNRLTKLIRNRVESQQVAEWFKPGRWQLFNECAILSIDPKSGRVANRRPDRVMTDGRQTIVVDFKFGHDCADYHEQVKRYMELLRDMGHQNVKGYLWLVYKNEIIEV